MAGNRLGCVQAPVACERLAIVSSCILHVTWQVQSPVGPCTPHHLFQLVVFLTRAPLSGVRRRSLFHASGLLYASTGAVFQTAHTDEARFAHQGAHMQAPKRLPKFFKHQEAQIPQDLDRVWCLTPLQHLGTLQQLN